ncbi:MAG: response regulator [Anaerolineae bacterium]|nr:response regulator [Anaerolineae bacterium]
MTGERILVIDDGPENIQFIVNYVLKPNGYIPLTASDGAEGLRRALAEEPDLILLDMQMPRMTGVQVLEALKAQHKDIPAILMTFHGSEDLVIQVFRLGVRDYVQKPFQVDEMLSVIDRALAEVRLRRERDELTERLLSSNRQLEARVKELNILYSIGKSVTAELDIDTLFSRLVDAAVYLTGAEEGWLMLVDDKTNELYVCAAKGLEERQARSLRLRVDDSIAGAVIKSGEPIVINSGEHKVKTAYLVRSLMAVPIKVGRRAIGVLNVDYRLSDRVFGSGTLHLLSALADYASIAIQNARLFNEIRDARGKLEAILTGTADGILVVDPERRVLLLNGAAADILGWQSEETTNQLLDDLNLPKELKTLFEQKIDVIADSRVEVLGKDGHTFNAHLTTVAEVGFVVVMQDVTYFKELESLKNEFVSTVSHDLRSPLTAIRGFVDLIEMTGPLTQQQTAFVDKIRNGVADITELITDLLDLSRIERGVEFEVAPLDLETIIFESVDVLHGLAAAKKQQVDLSLASGLSPVLGNRIRLGQVVKNLVGNAIKYTPERGHIRVSAEERDGQILVHVRDSGIGISAADQAQLFERFFRIRRPETDDIPGTGLGLAITKTIIEQHGGRIWVESELNRGSTFTFLVPAFRSSGR